MYQKALRIDPGFAPAHNNLGLALKGAGLWGGAQSAYREALRINPHLAPAHVNLGQIQAGLGQINEAVGHYRQALRVEPDFARAHYYLGVALVAKGRRDEVDEDYPEGAKPLQPFRESALREVKDYYAKARDLDPGWAAARDGLRTSPRDSARLDEAIDHYRQAIRLEPGRPRPHGALGQALLAKRQFAEAEAATRRCLELLLPRDTKLRANLERQRQRCRHLLALEGRLPGIVRGRDKPADDERLEAAELCFVKGHYAAAARVYAEALAATPGLAKDLRAGHRFNAARAAALAGYGRGEGAGLGEPERARWRQEARAWLRLDLAAWGRKQDAGTAADRIQAWKTLSRWRADPDLAGLRDPGALAGLPAAERQECRALWRDVEARLRSGPPPKEVPAPPRRGEKRRKERRKEEEKRGRRKEDERGRRKEDGGETDEKRTDEKRTRLVFP